MIPQVVSVVYGKKTAYTILKKYSSQLLDLIDFGEEPILAIDSELSLCAIKFVCLLYDEHFKSNDINSLLFKLFAKKEYQVKSYHLQSIHYYNT